MRPSSSTGRKPVRVRILTWGDVMDWAWADIVVHVFLIPIYQIVSTARHELSHAAAAKLGGLTVTSIKILPHRHNGSWYWGRVTWEGAPISARSLKAILMIPYFVDIFCLVVGVPVVVLHDWTEFHCFAVAVVMLIVSPLVDIAYNLLKWKIRGTGDWERVSESQ